MTGPITKRFVKFHKENRHVYRALLQVTQQMRGRGMMKVSVDFVYQVARWEIIKATNDIEFKLNDHYRAYYARLIMLNHPELEGMFDIRRSQADEWLADLIRRRQDRAS